jgi:ABC-type xylose transport system permease subunit
MTKTQKTILMSLLTVLYLIVSGWLAMMLGPIYGLPVFVLLFVVLTVILIFAFRKLK